MMSHDKSLRQFYNDLILQQDELIKQRDKLQKDLDDIEVVINVIKRQHYLNESNSAKSKRGDEKSSVSKPFQSRLFDIDGSIDKSLTIEDQIIQGFEAINKLVKVKEFARWFKQTTGSSKAEGSIISLVRKMRAKGDVINVKFNDNDANTYWGLPDWVVEGNDKREIIRRHYPDSNEITENSPYEINRK